MQHAETMLQEVEESTSSIVQKLEFAKVAKKNAQEKNATLEK
jgi:hypothetical protein